MPAASSPTASAAESRSRCTGAHATTRTSIEVWQPRSEETLAFAVARERALDAFYHPFAHLPTRRSDGSRGVLAGVRDRRTAPVPVAGLFETHLTVGDLEPLRRASTATSSGCQLALELPGARRRVLLDRRARRGDARALVARIRARRTLAARRVHDVARRRPGRVRSPAIARRHAALVLHATETTEPSVIGWMPAAAVYFRDPDGHLLEYLAMLDEPAQPERGIVSWSQWTSECQ